MSHVEVTSGSYPYLQFARHVTRLSRHSLRRLDPPLREQLGISALELSALRCVQAGYENPMRVAERLVLAPSSASRLVDKLAEQDIDAEVIDLRSIRPLDKDTFVESVKKTNRAVVVQEQWRYFSVASEVCAVLQHEAFDYLDAPVERVSGAEVPAPYARNLEIAGFPTIDHVVSAARRVLYLEK